jgi:aspartate aminotransferase/aminotransferase
MDVDVTQWVDAYRAKRDRLVEGLSDCFELVAPGGAFYAFPKAPWGSGSEFVAEAIAHNLLIIPVCGGGRGDRTRDRRAAETGRAQRQGIAMSRTALEGRLRSDPPSPHSSRRGSGLRKELLWIPYRHSLPI